MKAGKAQAAPKDKMRALLETRYALDGAFKAAFDRDPERAVRCALAGGVSEDMAADLAKTEAETLRRRRREPWRIRWD